MPARAEGVATVPSDPGSTHATAAPRLLLIGSAPSDGAEAAAAVRGLAAAWLRVGGGISFGAHPTLTGVVLQTARDSVRDRGRERVTAFRSR